MIYNNNINILANLSSNQLLTCDSVGYIKHNDGYGAGWHSPPDNLITHIRQSFEHYFNLIEIIQSKLFHNEQDINLPNLRKALSGLVVLAETYSSKKINSKYISQILDLYRELDEKIVVLEEKYGDQFYQICGESEYYHNTYVAIMKYENSLESIQTDLENLLGEDNFYGESNISKDKKRRLIVKFLLVIRDTLKNCAQTISEKWKKLVDKIRNLFRKSGYQEI